jgi:hypothetical protein
MPTRWRALPIGSQRLSEPPSASVPSTSFRRWAHEKQSSMHASTWPSATGATKFAAMAVAYHVQIVPQNPLSPIGPTACLQIAAAIPIFAIQEYSTGFAACVFESTVAHLGSDMLTTRLYPQPDLSMSRLAQARWITPRASGRVLRSQSRCVFIAMALSWISKAAGTVHIMIA